MNSKTANEDPEEREAPEPDGVVHARFVDYPDGTEPAGTLAAFCLCGGTLTGDVWPDAARETEALTSAWRSFHQGEGHGRIAQNIARSVRVAKQRSHSRPVEERGAEMFAEASDGGEA